MINFRNPFRKKIPIPAERSSEQIEEEINNLFYELSGKKDFGHVELLTRDKSVPYIRVWRR